MNKRGLNSKGQYSISRRRCSMLFTLEVGVLSRVDALVILKNFMQHVSGKYVLNGELSFLWTMLCMSSYVCSQHCWIKWIKEELMIDTGEEY